MSNVASQRNSFGIIIPRDLAERWPRVAPVLLVLVALAIRIYGVEANGLRSDEAQSLWMASRTIPDLFRTVVIEGHDATPPTFILLLHFVGDASQELWAIRLVSVLAGAGVVWLTFRLARLLFDFEIAFISGLLVAVSPFSVEYAQVARAHALASFFAVASLYMFSLLLLGRTHKTNIRLYAISTIAAISTHYLAGFVVVFENLVVVTLAIARRNSWHELWRWLRLQIVMGLAVMPVIWLAILKVPMAAAGLGQTWLASPTVQGIGRTLILWGTGDPSYGPARLTLARLASLTLILCILALGVVTAWQRRTGSSEERREVPRAGFVATAFAMPWLTALGVSLVRKVFSEKYFLYLIPLLIIVLAWSALRIKPTLLGRGLLIILVGQTLLALRIYHTSPTGEQWREAVAYVRQELAASDAVAVAPGYYLRPVAYYLTGSLPPHDYGLMHAPVVVIDQGGLMTANTETGPASVTGSGEAFGTGQRVWLITGYADVDPAQLSWFWQDYTETGRQDFLGVTVIRGESY